MLGVAPARAHVDPVRLRDGAVDRGPNAALRMSIAAFPVLILCRRRPKLVVDASGAAVGAVEGVRARVGWHHHRVDVVAQTTRFVVCVKVDGVRGKEAVAPLAAELALQVDATREGEIRARRARGGGHHAVVRLVALPVQSGVGRGRILGVDARGAAVGAVEGVRAWVGWHHHRIHVVAQTTRFAVCIIFDGVRDASVEAPLAADLALPEDAVRECEVGTWLPRQPMLRHHVIVGWRAEDLGARGRVVNVQLVAAAHRENAVAPVARRGRVCKLQPRVVMGLEHS